MGSTQVVDTELLDQCIAESGYKVNYIVEQLGLSRNGFDKKRKGINRFRKSEVYVLCDLLKLPNDVATKIFYPQG